MNENVSAGDLSGADALLETAWRCTVGLISGVPGYPITSLMDSFMRDSRFFDKTFWLTNEKVALEMALGASVTGTRALVLTKHVGMNVLCDPLVSSATHSIGAGVVIIAGDDPGVVASQNEQDSRNFGSLAEIGVFDPANPQDASAALNDAFLISEKSHSPVIVRVTSRLLESHGRVNLHDFSEADALFDPAVWDYTMKGKHQLFHAKSYPYLTAESERRAFSRLTEKRETIGIISSGYVSSIVDEVIEKEQMDCSHLSLCMVAPFPYRPIREFLEKYEYILVAEETETFLESHLCINPKVRGKLTGHLPYGTITAAALGKAVNAIAREHIVPDGNIETLASRGRHPICEDCPYLALYRVLGRMDVPVAGDIGCVIRSAPSPLRAVDTGFSLGSAISVACGFATRGISVIGDFGLAHSGIIGLINAVRFEADILVIVLNNHIAAMTGGQEVPDLINVVKQLSEDVVSIDGNNTSEAALEKLILEKLGQKGISVIFVEGRCTKYSIKEDI